jgi:HemY protein
MRRIFGIFLLAAVAMALAAWLADMPGTATVEFAGWRIDTSAGALAAAALAAALALVVLDRIWRFVVGAPGRISEWRRQRRTRLGHAALARGLVAIAAGEPVEAARQARLAARALDDAPVARLLAAQAAQLSGDATAARLHLEAMRASPETEFAALRGLVAEAMRAGEDARALELARRARDLRPAAPWVTGALVDLETRAGDWAAAADTLARARRAKLLPPEQADRNAAAVLHERARQLAQAGARREAMATAERALRLAPDRPEIAATLATLYAQDGRLRAAAGLIEKEWARRPHPDLAAAHRLARPAANPLDRMRQVERLARNAPDARESHVALAEAALEAELWGEAKRHGEAAVAASAGETSAGLCRLFARIERSRGDDPAAASAWLARAADAPPDNAWTCRACGQPHAAWAALCTNCGGFDRLEWRPPARLAAAPAAIELKTV